MDILLVAPSRTLDYAGEEVQKVINLLHPRNVLINAGATMAALLDAVQFDYDLIWFAGHSAAQGIELEDGYLSADSLTQFMKASGSAVFLNSCSSLMIALQINAQLKSTVIATIEDVDDMKAYQTGVLFAHALAKGQGLREAFDASNTVYTQYVFLPGIADDVDECVYLRGEIDVLRFMIEDLERRRHAQWIEYTIQSDGRYHPRLDTESARQWLFGFLFFVFNVFLFYSDVRHLLGISWIVALILAFISFPVSGYFFMAGMKLDPRRIARRIPLPLLAVIVLEKFIGDV